MDPKDLLEIAETINADDFYSKKDGLFGLMPKVNSYAYELRSGGNDLEKGADANVVEPIQL